MTRDRTLTSISLTPYLLAQRNIAIGDFPDEIYAWVIEHHMEMLDGVNALQRLPVLEPDDLRMMSKYRHSSKCVAYMLSRHSSAKSLRDIAIDLFSCLGG